MKPARVARPPAPVVIDGVEVVRRERVDPARRRRLVRLLVDLLDSPDELPAESTPDDRGRP